MTSLLPETTHNIQIRNDVFCSSVPEDILTHDKPILLKGFAKSWPIVAIHHAEAANYLQQLHNGQTVTLLELEASEKGRFFYNKDMTGFNFSRQKAALSEVLDGLKGTSDKS